MQGVPTAEEDWTLQSKHLLLSNVQSNSHHFRTQFSNNKHIELFLALKLIYLCYKHGCKESRKTRNQFRSSECHFVRNHPKRAEKSTTLYKLQCKPVQEEWVIKCSNVCFSCKFDCLTMFFRCFVVYTLTGKPNSVHDSADGEEDGKFITLLE